MQTSEWNRAKRKRKTIEVLYEVGKSTLKVLKVSGKHLECMGIPVKGGYELYPEEAVYLLETGSATISASSGKELSLLESLSILERNGVPMYKYEIYKQVKRTGLVVLRPRKSTIDFERVRQAERETRDEMVRRTFELAVNLNQVPQEGVRFPDNFPTFATSQGKVFVELRVLHTDPRLVNFLSHDVIDNFPTSSVLQQLPPPTSNAQRRKACRPIYLPEPRTRNVCNWEEFRFEAEKMAQSAMLSRLKKLRPPRPEDLRRERITVDLVDFHVFSPAAFSRRLPARPLFSLVCHRATGPSLQVSKLAELRNVVLAAEESGKVSFVSVSGAPIDLIPYLH